MRLAKDFRCANDLAEYWCDRLCAGSTLVECEKYKKAVALASSLHYELVRNSNDFAKGHDPEGEGNVEFLRQGRSFGKVAPISLPELKKGLSEAGHAVSRDRLFSKRQTNIAKKVAVVDYGMGNIYSLAQALNSLGAQPIIVSSADQLQRADSVILPGVGAFGEAMLQIEKRGIRHAIIQKAKSKTPLFGICLGMQILFSESHEHGRYRGLDLIRGTVERFPEVAEDGQRLRVPNIGWRKLGDVSPTTGESLLGIARDHEMYFVHSYFVIPTNAAVTTSTSNYCGINFCASVLSENLFATQFHPEKSGDAGISIIERWLKSI
jgi:glutamine amidotransferase